MLKFDTFGNNELNRCLFSSDGDGLLLSKGVTK